MQELRDTPGARAVGCIPELDFLGALDARHVIGTKLQDSFHEGLSRELVLVDS